MTAATANKVNQHIGKLMVPIMAIYALGASQGGINAGIATMGAAFPEAGANIAYVVSIVALGMIPAGAITGIVSGRYIKYRTSILVAIILYLISGLLPVFMGDSMGFTGLLVSRFIFGVAVGWCYPLAQALVFKSVDDEHQRAKWLGIGWAFVNIGSALMELFGGYLALVGWQMCFWVYAIGIIPFIFVLVFLKEPETDAQQAAERAAAHGATAGKAHIPALAFVYVIMLTLTTGFAMPTILYCSFIVPDSAVAGITLSVMTLVGAVSGFTLGPVYKAIGKWTLPVSVLVLGVLYCVAAAFSADFQMIPYLIGFLAGHWGFAIVIPATADMITNLTPIGAATRAMGWNTAFHQIGCFIGTPVGVFVLGLVGSQNPVDCVMPCSIAIVVLGVIYCIIAAFTKMEKYGENYEVELEAKANTEV